jgi:predicted  nucleic acid-binding Zn-ribbon protein
MADVEYKGVHVTGIKGSYLLVLFPLFASIIGGLWGGFELYKRYEDMEKMVSEYEAPDLSGFTTRLEVFDTKLNKELKMVATEINTLKELVQNAQETARDIRTDIKGEVNKQEDQIAAIDKRSRVDSQETRVIIRNAEKNFNELEMGVLSMIRELISNTSKRWDDKLTKVDSQIENLEKKLDKKITKALENPLAAMSKSKSTRKKFPWQVQR